MILQTTFFTCLRQLVIRPVAKNIQLPHLSMGLKKSIPEIIYNIVYSATILLYSIIH